MIDDRSKTQEMTDHIEACPAPGKPKASGIYPGQEKPAIVSDNSEHGFGSLGTIPDRQIAMSAASGTPASEAPVFGQAPPTDEGIGSLERERFEPVDFPINQFPATGSANAVQGGAERLGAGSREAPGKGASVTADDQSKPREKRASNSDPFELSRLWAENLVPVGDDQNLNYPPNISSFRHYPERFIGDIAEDPLEMMLLSALRHFHGQVDYYMSIAGDTRDPAYRISFLNYCMRLSDQQIKISDAIRRGRRDGRQEVIVKHQEGDGAPGRRPRARRFDRRENTAKVSPAKRSAAT